MSSSFRPLHPSIAKRVDPEYEQFYNTHLGFAPPDTIILQELKLRSELIPGGTKPLPVGNVVDFSIERGTLDANFESGSFQARCFIPGGDAPTNGWPVVLYLHSGGWVLGTIDTENNICTQICNGVRGVVVSPDYRFVHYKAHFPTFAF